MNATLRTIRNTLLAATAGAILAASPVLARDFRSADIHPNDYPTVEAVKYMDKLLKEQTNGKLGVKVFANGALGNERDTIEQLKIGGLDMMRINVAPLNNVVPETMAVALPFLFRSTEHMRTVLDGPIGNEVLAAMEPQGMIGLAFYDSGSRSFYTKKPVKTLADLKGMKIRVQQSDLFVSMIEALGANPTPMPMGEVYTALKTGIIDAAENNYPSYESSRHFEAAKFYNRTQHVMAPEVLVFSKVVWDRLSKDDQTLIRKAAKDSVPYMRKLWDEREAKSKAIVEQAGSQILDVENPKEFSDAMKPVYAKFADTPRLQNLVKRIQDTK
ncbi:TRAP transporter substrate-binding protein [Azospirillum sp. TSO22-1]|uniref:TRAP transporter substrate-binding protein n=1 Tax=Azospirillum sp. TSO22-1 TaxID=716789 RepID=UPI000D613BC2|nr:TRAP transporter substrate-binding protein [Azospirillum sp. TSO22-1]PWC55258.1 C4-dicarboxylate ABC transporter [Azospirillum sp. TSO22-1]